MKNAESTKATGPKRPVEKPRTPADRKRTTARGSVNNKMGAKKTRSAQSTRIKIGTEPKSDRLACRYCASEDLAPSFVKRRDRRCRQCFSQRYPTARTQSAKTAG
jgi:hypothetical protein